MSAGFSFAADAPSPEPWLAAAMVAAALLSAHFRFRLLGAWERPLARLARRRRLAIVSAALLPLAMRGLLLPWFPAPEPRVHDEFSFLLAADTFAHGRLANPSHAFWPHFESMHIIVKPVYASAFPAAQAAALAGGKVLLGHAWAGVWLSTGFLCGAMCWMLQGWLPPRWALLGALLVILRIAVSSYWMNTYWGGSVAAAGGALVLGALPRMQRKPHWRYALAMGSGLAILAHSRPVEGGFFAVLIAVTLLAWMRGADGPPRTIALRQIVLPLLVILTLTGAATASYFARITGKPWVPPYVAYRNAISIAPHFMWQTPTAEPLYNNAEMRDFYVNHEMARYFEARNFPFHDLWQKASAYWRFYLGPFLTIPMLALPRVLRQPRMKPMIWIAAVFPLVLAGQVWHNVHYAAPATGLVALILVQAMRHLRVWRYGSTPVGLCFVRCAPFACAAMLIIQIAAGSVPETALEVRGWRWSSPGGADRARVLRQLTSLGGQHLVLVRYAAAHNPGNEWVYNGADIDRSAVVWARELDRGSNADLMAYFRGRQVWLVEPDVADPHPVPYREAPVRLMPFVQLGAPGIAAIRSVEDIKRKLLDLAGSRAEASCHEWNSVFSEATGIAGPSVDPACYGGAANGRVSFETWFDWLRRQR